MSYRRATAQHPTAALGSGFVISEDGFIVTNNHVIEGADEILIEFFPGGEAGVPAELIGTDPNTDIAVLKVDLDNLPFVEFGDSNGPGSRVGDWVMAMGNPLGQGFSVSAGIVSARNRALSGTSDDYIQTYAAINRGNSGGPLFNMDGEVIGVNTAILSPNGGSIGIGFAMSSAVVTNVVDQLIEFGETRRGWLANAATCPSGFFRTFGQRDRCLLVLSEAYAAQHRPHRQMHGRPSSRGRAACLLAACHFQSGARSK